MRKNIFTILSLFLFLLVVGCNTENRESNTETPTDTFTTTTVTISETNTETEVIDDVYYIRFFIGDTEYATWDPLTPFNVDNPVNGSSIFLGWKITGTDGEEKDFNADDYYNETIDADINVYSSWLNIGDTVNYTVNIYCQNISDDDYTLHDSENRSEIYNTEIVVHPQIMDGFFFNSTKSDSGIGVINNQTVNLYYDRLTYFVTFNGNGGTLVSGTSTQSVRHGGSAVAPTFEKPGYIFNRWDADFTNITYTKTINAIYDVVNVYYNFTSSSTTGGSITGSTSGTYLQNTSIALSATADAGYIFSGWYLNDELVSLEPAYDFVITKDTTLVAKFEKEASDLLIISPTAANHNVWQDQSINYSGIYFFKKGVNTSLTHESGITTASNTLATWIRIAIDYDTSSSSYKVVAVMLNGDTTYTDAFNNALYKVMVWSGANLDDSVFDTFNAVEVGQTVVFNNFNLDEGSFQEGATIMISNEFSEVESIEIIGSNEGFVGNNIKLETTFTPSHANELVTWSSSDEAIARVDSNGNVTLLSAGNVTIQAATSKATASHNITVSIDSSYEGYKNIDKNIASGYVYRNYNLLTEEFFETMDIVFCAFVLVDVNGAFTGLDGLNASISSTNSRSLSNMSTYVIEQAHSKGVRAVVSIGGGGEGQDLSFEAFTKDATLRANFVNNIITLINQYHFDGVDIDWECPDPSSKTYFTLLMKELYTAVKSNNRHHIVTAAIGAGKWQPPNYDLENSIQYMDYINMMSYTMCSSDGYYQNALYQSTTYNSSEAKVGYTMSSCSIDESVALYNSYGIPNNKIIVGLVFYGIAQTRESTSDNWKRSSSIYYNVIKTNYLTDSNYTYHYDSKAGVPYLLSKDLLTFISYDDPKSIIAKCTYVKTKGLAGVMYWENGCDNSGDLVGAINTGLKK